LDEGNECLSLNKLRSQTGREEIQGR
jgi:hypothetical protein